MTLCCKASFIQSTVFLDKFLLVALTGKFFSPLGHRTQNAIFSPLILSKKTCVNDALSILTVPHTMFILSRRSKCFPKFFREFTPFDQTSSFPFKELNFKFFFHVNVYRNGPLNFRLSCHVISSFDWLTSSLF